MIPTGIAVNDSNKYFFSKLIDENRLVSLYDFENREKLFDIDSTNHFCLLTIGKEQDTPRTVKGGFFLTRLDHLLDPRRIYPLQTSDYVLTPTPRLAQYSAQAVTQSLRLRSIATPPFCIMR